MALPSTTLISGISRPIDLIAKNFVRPPSPECYEDNETITVRLVSEGSAPLNFSTNPATITVTVTGPVPATHTATVNTGTLATFDSLDVLVTNTGDFSVLGRYDMLATVDVSGDTILTNNNTTDIVWIGFLTEDFETFTPGGNGIIFPTDFWLMDGAGLLLLPLLLLCGVGM